MELLLGCRVAGCVFIDISFLRAGYWKVAGNGPKWPGVAGRLLGRSGQWQAVTSSDTNQTSQKDFIMKDKQSVYGNARLSISTG